MRLLFIHNKYVRPRDTRPEMYAGRVACCPLVSRVARRIKIRKKTRETARTDGHHTDALFLPLDVFSVISCILFGYHCRPILASQDHRRLTINVGQQTYEAVVDT